MNKLTEKEYVNERITNIKHYIEFNEREDDKNFFAYKELELYKKAQKYIELTDKLGCPLDVLFKALQNGVWVEANPIDIDFENPKTMYLEKFLTLEKRLDETLCLDAKDYVDELELKDYKKTWWLSETKED